MADSPSTASDDLVFSTGNQQPCPDCGEMVRQGVVRCWNCGAFMDKEVEARFLKMQETPPAVLYSDPPPEAAAPAVAPLSDDDTSDSDDDGGFELNTGGSAGTFSLAGMGTLPADVDDGAGGDAAGEPEAKASDPSSGQPPADPPAPAAEDDPLMASVMSDLKGRKDREVDTLARLKGGVRTAGGFIIFCPYGCTIEVKDRNRGSMGKCPKCNAPFVVPVDPPNYKTAAKASAKKDGEAGGPAGYGQYGVWLSDVRLHTLPPDKIKLKADAHAKDFQPFDLAISPDKLVLISLAGKGGLFGGGAKPEENRKAVQDLATEGADPKKWLEDATVHTFGAGQIDGFRLVQPVPAGEQSIFQGIPVFGAGRVVLAVPGSGSEEPMYVSLGVTQFREFSAALAKHYGREGVGETAGIPMTDKTFKHTCHYTDVEIHALQDLPFYRADDTVELVVAGYQCEHCGLTVSEDGRKKEGLGGKAGKGIAKAKCPKCGEKMGEKKLETRRELLKEAEMVSET